MSCQPPGWLPCSAGHGDMICSPEMTSQHHRQPSPLTTPSVMNKETITVVIPTAYHSMPALVCVAQAAGQRILEKPHAALLHCSTAQQRRRALCQALTQLSVLAPQLRSPAPTLRHQEGHSPSLHLQVRPASCLSSQRKKYSFIEQVKTSVWVSGRREERNKVMHCL